MGQDGGLNAADEIGDKDETDVRELATAVGALSQGASICASEIQQQHWNVRGEYTAPQLASLSVLPTSSNKGYANDGNRLPITCNAPPPLQHKCAGWSVSLDGSVYPTPKFLFIRVPWQCKGQLCREKKTGHGLTKSLGSPKNRAHCSGPSKNNKAARCHSAAYTGTAAPWNTRLERSSSREHRCAEPGAELWRGRGPPATSRRGGRGEDE
jgi:hypothetical protein